jgi:amino acid transporter
LLLFFIVGDMIGGGIYALVGEVGAITGGAIWTAFAFAMILAVFTAFAYAELVTKYPQAGGAATYVHRAFRTPIVSFMVAFAVTLSGITSASALSLAFGADYLSQFITIPAVLAAVILFILVQLLNFRGISESTKVNATFTTIELLGLLLIVVVGFAAVAAGEGDPSRALQFQEGGSAPGLILAGAALAFYALIGFEDSVNLAEEARDPSRTYPRVLFTGLLLAGTIYLLVTIAASMAVPTGPLTDPEAETTALLQVAQSGPLAVPPTLFALIGLFALSNGVLLNMVMASRLVYGMANQGVMPSVLGRVHPVRRTPWVAIIFITVIAICLILTGDVSSLASATVVLLLLVFISVNVAVLVLKRDRVDHDHFSAPSFIPILGIIVCAGLLTQQELATYALVGGLLVLGLILYGVNYLAKRALDKTPPGAPSEPSGRVR